VDVVVGEVDLGDPRVAERQPVLGAVARVTNDLAIFEAKSRPPQQTRARLRGEFIKRAQERRRDFTVDWVHLKLNDQAQRTVLCKDPFRSVDDRVERLIQSM
jgi:proteasome accessory factor A